LSFFSCHALYGAVQFSCPAGSISRWLGDTGGLRRDSFSEYYLRNTPSPLHPEKTDEATDKGQTRFEMAWFRTVAYRRWPLTSEMKQFLLDSPSRLGGKSVAVGCQLRRATGPAPRGLAEVPSRYIVALPGKAPTQQFAAPRPEGWFPGDGEGQSPAARVFCNVGSDPPVPRSVR
jgi:hypothetical protein